MNIAFQSSRVNVMAQAAAFALTGHRQGYRWIAAMLAGILLLLSASRATAQISAMEIAPPDLTTNQGFGESACASGGLFAVGSPLDDTKGSDAGAVHVFNGTTGVRLRKLFAPVTEAGANDRFGAAMAAAGTILAVGAPGEASGGSERGAVYLYNLQTGAFLRTLRAPDGADGDKFGAALAMDGELLVIGAPSRDENGASNCGAIYIFNLKSNVFNPASGPAKKLTTADAEMGFSVSIDGTLVMAGAPGEMVNGVATGSIYLLDGETLAPVFDGAPDNLLPGSRYGHSVAVSHGLYYAGAPMFNNGRGRIYKARLVFPTNVVHILAGANEGEKWGWSMSPGPQFLVASAPGYIVNTGITSFPAAGTVAAVAYSGGVIEFLSLADGVDNDQLGFAVAVTGNRVLATGPGRDAHATDAGTAVIFSPVLEPGDSNGLAARGNAAPGALGTVFSTFNELTVSPNGFTSIHAGLAGPGSLNGKNSGIWTEGNPDGFFNIALVKRAGAALAGARIGTSFSRPVSNEDSTVGFQAMTSGSGITTANDAVYALWNWNTATFSMPLVEGQTVVGNGVLSTFQTPRMGWTGEARLATPYTNKLGGTVTAINDSGIVQFDATGVLKTLSENSESPVSGVNFGQFQPHLSYHSFDTTFAAFLQVPKTTDNVGVFHLDHLDNRTLLARKGAPAPNETGATFGTFTNFLSVVNSINRSLFRATIAPPPGFAAQNEGLWSTRSGALRPLLMKGRTYAGLPAGTTIKSFVRYGFDSNANLLAWVVLQGTGVTQANDGAVILSRLVLGEPGAIELLVREGSPVLGCSRARVASIQTVDVEHQGVYAVLASLVVEAGGATAQDNQVLLLGRTNDGSATQPCLRKARLAMRKGMGFKRVGAQSVNSISLPGFITDATGGLDTGLAHVVRSSFPNPMATAQVLFSDGSGSVQKVQAGF
jgi:hypothetical protein